MFVIFYLPAIVISLFPCFFLKYIFAFLGTDFPRYPYAGPIILYFLIVVPLFAVSFISPIVFTGGLPADENAGDVLVLYFQGACIGIFLFSGIYWTYWKFA